MTAETVGMQKLLFSAVAIPMIAILIHEVFMSWVETPPPDFGSGSMFDKIAHRYDFINRVMAFSLDIGWREKLVASVHTRVPTTASGNIVKLVDMATGTADVAILLAQTIPDSTVLGIDPSNNMLDVGRTKITSKNLQDRITLVTGDAQSLDISIPKQSFDGATMAFGIRNVPDRNAALCEIHSLLKTGGVMSILELSEPDQHHSGLFGLLTKFFIRHVVPILGGILSGKPREYLHLQHSIKDFPPPKQFSATISSLTCGDHSEGYFVMENIDFMGFGCVQLYVFTIERHALPNSSENVGDMTAAAAAEEENEEEDEAMNRVDDSKVYDARVEHEA